MKKTFAILMALAMALTTAACAKSPATVPENEVSAQSSSASADDATAEPDDGITRYAGDIIISLQVDAGNQKLAQFEALEKAYKEKQPDVNLIWEPTTSDQYPTWLTTQLASGNIRPDIVSGNYSKEYLGYVNLDLYRNRENPYSGKVWQDEFNFDLVNERNSKGAKFMLPSEAVHILWFYNETIFNEQGITPPTTDAEFIEACEKLLAAGYTPFASNFAWQTGQWFVEVYYDQFTRSFDEYMRAQPGDWMYDEELDGSFKYDPNDIHLGSNYTYSAQRLLNNIKNGVYRFDSPEFIAWADAYQKMFSSKYNYAEFSVDNDHYSRFLAGKTAMMTDGTWSLIQVQRDLENISPERLEALKLPEGTTIQAFEWGTFENPNMTGAYVQGPVRTVESSTGVYLSIIDKEQEQVDRCVDFAQFWFSQEGYQAWVDGALNSTQGFTPGGPLQIHGVKLPEQMQATLDGIKLLGNAEYLGKSPIGILTQEFDQYGKDLLLSLLDNEITPEAYAAQMQKILDDNLEKIVINSGFTMEDVEFPEREPAN